MSSSGLFPGKTEQAGLPQPIPLWSLLRLCEAEGAGVPQHCVDRRVHRSAAQDQDRQLHSHLLTLLCSCPTLPPLESGGTPNSLSCPLPRLQGCPIFGTGSNEETVQLLVKLFKLELCVL